MTREQLDSFLARNQACLEKSFANTFTVLARGDDCYIIGTVTERSLDEYVFEPYSDILDYQ